MRYGTMVLALCAALALAGGAQADLVTGNPAADGWAYQGHSLAQGTYIRGSENIGFDMYTTVYTVSNPSAYALTGHDDASYLGYYESSHWTKADARAWNVGDTVIGIGGVFAGITAEEAGWDAFTGKGVNSTIDNEHRFRLQAKIGTENATWSPSTVAPDQGDGHGSTNDGGAGSFLVRTSGWHGLGAWEDFAGTMLGLQKTSHIGGYAGTDVARVIWTWNDEANRVDSWQILINLDLLADDYAAAGFEGLLPGQPGTLVIGSVQIASAGYTDALGAFPALGGSAPIPLPPSMAMALMGLAGAGGFARLRRRASGK